MVNGFIELECRCDFCGVFFMRFRQTTKKDYKEIGCPFCLTPNIKTEMI